MEEQNQPLPCPIAGEPAEVSASQNARIGEPMTLVPRQTTLEAIEQGQGRIDRLYCNAMGIVDRLARDVMQSMATDVMESLNNAEGTLKHDLMGLRASLAFAVAEYADVEDGWASIAGDLAHTIYNAMGQIDEMLGLKD